MASHTAPLLPEHSANNVAHRAIMTSSHGHAFRIAGPLSVEYTSPIIEDQ